MTKPSHNASNRSPVLVREKKDDQGFWFFFFTLIFITLALFFVWVLLCLCSGLPTRIPFFDVVLITLASFRLTRLFVYDDIMLYVRSFFLDKTKVDKGEEGVVYEYFEPKRGPMKTLWHLANCPWCAGLWFSLLLVFVYYLTPYSWIFILVLAVAGVSTLIQLFANWLGSSAKGTRLRNEQISKNE